MKKVILSIVIAITTFSAIAQNNKVQSAFGYKKYKEYDKAKEAIDLAVKHSATMSKAKTWYYRGEIYLGIYETEKFKHLDPNALGTAFESYLKAFEFDTKKIDAQDLAMKLSRTTNMLVNSGIKEFNAKEYEKALASFTYAMRGAKQMKYTDSLSTYYGAVSAKNLGQDDKAIELLNKCIAINYQGPLAYYTLGEIYLKQEKREKYVEAVKAGRLKYPDDANLLTSEINIFLENEDAEGALSALNLALEKDTLNKVLMYARGNMYEKTGDLENAKIDYKKAIEIDEKYFDANYNLGALIFNDAVSMMEKINEIKDLTKYAEEKKKADEKFLLSIPYLEKAHEIDPTDKSTMLSLKQLYGRTNQTDKYMAIKEKLEN